MHDNLEQQDDTALGQTEASEFVVMASAQGMREELSDIARRNSTCMCCGSVKKGLLRVSSQRSSVTKQVSKLVCCYRLAHSPLALHASAAFKHTRRLHRGRAKLSICAVANVSVCSQQLVYAGNQVDAVLRVAAPSAGAR